MQDVVRFRPWVASGRVMKIPAGIYRRTLGRLVTIFNRSYHYRKFLDQVQNPSLKEVVYIYDLACSGLTYGDFFRLCMDVRISLNLGKKISFYFIVSEYRPWYRQFDSEFTRSRIEDLKNIKLCELRLVSINLDYHRLASITSISDNIDNID